MLIKAALVAYFLALTLWVGGLIVLSFLVAPSIFKTNPSKTQAGKTFGEILGRFNYVEFACALVLLVSYGRIYKILNAEILNSDTTLRWVINIRAILIALMAITLLAYGLYVNPKLRQMRVEQNINFDDGANSRWHTQFKRLHKISVALTAVNMLFGFLLLVLSCLSVANILE